MDSEFYRAFEDRFRGPRDIIKSRFRVYLPFIEPLNDAYPDVQIVDLGCGRGEWLELLSENGFSGLGIDIDEEMLALCRELDLQVQTNDALSYLKNVPDESLAAITAFHLVEHIPFEDLQVLVEESLRVLKPAGLLILETPNPENLVVGTSSFYLDPTHKRPVPPELLTFIPEYYGFGRVKILRLQEPTELADSDNLSLMNVLGGVSPDYGVVAQKSTDDEQFEIGTEPFDAEYGVTLEQLARSYSHQTEDTMSQNEWLKNELQVANTRLEQLVSKLAASRTDAKNLRARLSEKNENAAKSDAALSEYQKRLRDLQNELNAVRTRLEELVGQLAAANAEVKHLNKEFKNKGHILHDDTAALIEQQMASQRTWQEVLDAARTRQEELAGELAASLHQVAQLNEELKEKSRVQTELQVVRNEWDAAKARLHELNLSNHNWWLLADALSSEVDLLKLEMGRLGGELQEISGSKSWRYTRPLRHLMQSIKWLSAWPARILERDVQSPGRTNAKLPDNTSKTVLTVSETGDLDQDSNLDEKLEHHAETAEVAEDVPESSDLEESPGADEEPEQDEDLASLTPDTGRIYQALKNNQKKTQGKSE